MESKSLKKYPTIGVCGLDCGLCPRYYTKGPSRCPGCGGPHFADKHPTCSFITCCVKKNNLEVCGQCPDFPCSKFKTDREYQQLKESSSYPSVRVILSNLRFIKKHGIKKFMDRQEKRIRLLEEIIENFDDGRSRSFFCRAACLLDLRSLQSSLNKALAKIEADNIGENDIKAKAKILKEYLTIAASKKAVELFKK